MGPTPLRNAWGLFAVAACLLGAGPALGQIVRDGSIGPGVEIQPEGPDYALPEDFGERRGDNLFHSFSDFNLSAEESATFSGSAGIESVFARVTGGEASSIDGLLRSTIDGAHLFLLNPYGVQFGRNARLDIAGSFTASTADYLRLGSGADTTFFDTHGDTSVLSTESLAAFGFWDDTLAAPIDVEGSLLEVPEGETLGLIGGDLSLHGEFHLGEDPDVENSTLVAPGGRIELVSVASGGEVVLGGAEDPLDVSSFSALGDIELVGDLSQAGFDSFNAVANVVGDGGSVFIRGGNFVLRGGGAIAATHEADTDHPGTAVDIRLRSDFVMGKAEPDSPEADGLAEIGASTRGLGDAGDIWIEAWRVLMRGSAADQGFTRIGSRSFGKLDDADVVVGGGDGGRVDIRANELRISANSSIDAATNSQGSGGDIEVHAAILTLDVEDGLTSFISASAEGRSDLGFGSLDHSGDAGSLRIRTDRMSMTGRLQDDLFTGFAVQARTDVAGNPNGGLMEILPFGELDPGERSLSFLNGAQINTTIFSGSGTAGDIRIGAQGDAYDAVVIDGFQSGIFSDARDAGTGGNLEVHASSIELSNFGEINASAGNNSFGSSVRPQGGDIHLFAERLDLSTSATIAANGRSIGAAGNIFVEAGEVSVRGPSALITPSGFNAFTGIFAVTFDQASSGSIQIDADSVSVTDGGEIRATSFFSTEPAGRVDVNAETVLLSGVDFNNTNLLGQPRASQISSEGVIAAGGEVNVSATEVRLDDSAVISTTAAGLGAAGDVRVSAERVYLDDAAQIASSHVAILAPGDGGSVSVEGRELVSIRGSRVSAFADNGNGGFVGIFAGDLVLSDAEITARASGGDGGEVFIEADDLYASDSSIAAQAQGFVLGEAVRGGAGGSVRIEVARNFEIRDTEILATSNPGDGGEILFEVGRLFEAVDSSIAARAGASEVGGVLVGGDGGNVFIDPELVVLNRTDIEASAVVGDGGEISIVADGLVRSSGSSLLVSSELGVEGELAIDAIQPVVVGDVVPLPQNFLDASALMKGRCSEGQDRGSFVLGGRDGPPAEPDGFLSAPMIPRPGGPALSLEIDLQDLPLLASSAGCRF